MKELRDLRPYKTAEEMKGMTVKEIQDYIAYLENNDKTAHRNGPDYINWCATEFDQALEDKEISIDEFMKILKSI